MLSALVLAFGLALDAAAAMGARGLAAATLRLRDVVLAALLVGLAHAITVTTGWLAGAALGEPFERVDHWVAFVLLMGLGGWTVISSLRAPAGGVAAADVAAATSALGGDAGAEPDHGFRLGSLLILAVATSIDGLAAGVTVPLLSPPPPVTIALVSAVTAGLAAVGTYLGRAAGARLGERLHVLGGLALCGLAVKILIEHT